MKWKLAPEALKTLLQQALESVDCEKKVMFGYPAYFINQNMFMGLFEDKIFIRLSEKQQEDFKSKGLPFKHLEPMAGRPMKEYFVLPKSFYSDDKAFKSVIEKSSQYTRSLPRKVKKGKKSK